MRKKIAGTRRPRLEKKMNYARKLKLCRKNLHLTQAGLAEMFGTTPMQIYRMESEKAKIPQNIQDWLDKQEVKITTQVEVGHRTKELREALGMNRNQFAEFVGCSGSTISRIEDGRNMIEKSLAMKIAEKCRIGVDWLLTGDEEKKKWPVDRPLIEFLWSRPDLREKLWDEMDGAAHR